MAWPSKAALVNCRTSRRRVTHFACRAGHRFAAPPQSKPEAQASELISPKRKAFGLIAQSELQSSKTAVLSGFSRIKCSSRFVLLPSQF
jgi:hypothetical protein